jgi:hypothetical protein
VSGTRTPNRVASFCAELSAVRFGNSQVPDDAIDRGTVGSILLLGSSRVLFL